MAISAAAKSPSEPSSRLTAWLLQETGIEILRKVTQACEKAAIPLLPVKGIVTSRVLYDDAADRPITDVDVRIRPRDFANFQRTATALGWRCGRVARAYGNLVYDFGALSLDVESHVGPPGLCALSVDDMLGRSERAELVPGLRIHVPDLHDHAVLLTVNAFKDKIVTAPSWALADLERIVSVSSFRPDRFVERVRQSRIATVTWIVASWMESARSSSTWGRIRLDIESSTRVRRGYARLVQRQLATAHRAPMSLRLLARIGADGRAMQLKALLGALAWSAERWMHGPDTPPGCSAPAA